MHITTGSTSVRAKPTDDQLDIYALTHQGMVRTENQDHFLVCQLKKQMEVLHTSLPNVSVIPADQERLAMLMMVADGVGGHFGGEEASRVAVKAVAQYLSESVHVYYTVDTTDDSVFAEKLAAAALRAHERVLERREANPALGRAATTLTLWIGVWPRVYLVQLGDSRYYVLKGDDLVQISRDQTVAQDLLDQGVLTPEQASRGWWSHTLSNAIGGVESHPVVTSIENDWKYVHLLCSDGLTKHVSNDQIKERLQAMTSAQQACEALLQDALDAGGTDNITVVVGRASKGV